jgi:lipopolysaccharide transport system ATP-binding protein
LNALRSVSATPDQAISIRDLGKCYEIYAKPRDRLLQTLFRGRRRFYREFWALRNVSFDVGRGQTVGILGRNGAGKSTLLQLIAGTLTPTTGSAAVCGRVAALLELGAGFNPEFSGADNVRLNAAIMGLTEREIDERFDAIARFADLGEFLDQPVKTYSSGMYARLAFAVAAHMDADILIVDETLSVGDIKFQNKCIRRLVEFAERGTTILFVTHSVEQVKSFCDHAIWLHDGLLHQQGLPADLGRRYVNYMIHGVLEGDLPGPAPAASATSPSDAGGDSPPWTPITAANHVVGVRDVKVAAVRFFREVDRHLATVVEDGDFDVVVEAELQADRDIRCPLLAAGIFNELNEPIVHFNNANLGIALDPIAAGGRVCLRFSFRLPTLMVGHYLLALGVDDGVPGASEVLCHVYDAVEVRRVTGPGQRPVQAGYVEMPDAAITIEQRVAHG